MPPLASRFAYPLRMIGISTGLFLSGFLFETPGICAGPGLLGDHEVTGAIVFTIAFWGIALGVLWLVVVSGVRLARRGRSY